MVETAAWLRWLLRLAVVGYVTLLVGWPVALVAEHTFAHGLTDLSVALSDPDVVHALQLTGVVAAVAVLMNLVFGVGMSLLLVRYRFPGKRVLSALVDLPLAVSPVVVGLALLLVYNGRDGLFGPQLEAHGIRIIFAIPGIVMATVFVSLPLVVREVAPVLEEIGDEQEQAATSLGAGPVATFRRITLPAIKWALLYGLVLALARSLGEFGAVNIVSGNLVGQTQTATLVVQQSYQDFQEGTAYATAFILAVASVACITIVSIARPKEHP